MLSIHPKTVQRYIREGKLRAAKIGKSWRVSGHDLSVFAEATNDERNKSDVKDTRVTASCVIDIDVISRDEAIRIVNTLSATMNVKPPEYGQSSMHTQFIEADDKVRITLWGDVKFIAVILDAIDVLTQQTKEQTK